MDKDIKIERLDETETFTAVMNSNSSVPVFKIDELKVDETKVCPTCSKYAPTILTGYCVKCSFGE